MLALLASLGALVNGCALFAVGAAAGAGAAGYAYVKGELKSTEPASLDRTWDATLASMKDLQFTVISQAKDSLQARLEARDSADKKIEIKLKRVSDTTTDVRIRVGAFGDEALSHVILDKIRQHL